jgi:penicillin-binding protein 1B
LEGAETALPIWTEFMKRAHQHRSYRNPRPFYAPEGVVNVSIDPNSGKLAAGSCGTQAVAEVFVAGTEPVELCNGGGAQVAGWDLPGMGEDPPLVAANASRSRTAPVAPRTGAEPPSEIVIELPAAEEPAKKKGLFGKILDIFR